MGSTFTHKLFLTLMSGLAAACLFWAFRHIVQRGLHETGEGWSEMFEKTEKRPRQ